MARTRCESRYLGAEHLRLVVGRWFQGKRAGRGALGWRKRPARFKRRQVAERGVRPDSIVVIAPEGDLPAGVIQGVEDLLVQQFDMQAPVERLDEGVLLRFAGIDVVPGDVVLLGPFQNGSTGELGAIITDDTARLAVDPDQRIQLARNPCAREAGVGDQTQVLASASGPPPGCRAGQHY